MTPKNEELERLCNQVQLVKGDCTVDKIDFLQFTSVSFVEIPHAWL